MLGGLYTQEKCPTCNNSLEIDTKREGFFCHQHPEQVYRSKIFVKFPQGIFKRFGTDWMAAYQFLHGLRHESTQGKFDAREYQKESPLSFERYAARYLEAKRRKGLRSIQEVERIITQAAKFFSKRSVKVITRGDLSEYLFALNVSDKTRHNHMTQLRNFFRFVQKEERPNLFIPPDMPEIEFDLGWRNTVDIETQTRILQQIHDDHYISNPKIYIAVALLCNHLELRPDDIRRIDEGDVSAKGEIIIRKPTKKKNRFHVVYVCPSGELQTMIIEMKKRFPALPSVPFFRHHPKHNKVKPDSPFGVKLLYKVAKAAMKKHGIDDVDLYALTRHSTVTALADAFGEDAGREATDHRTNAAFSRYYVKRKGGQEKTAIRLDELRGKLIPLRKTGE